MTIRTRLAMVVLLFASAVLLNITALFYLVHSVTDSLTLIERVRDRQLVAVQMSAHLRDAEAALYRYQIEGEQGFATQFETQIQKFGLDVEQYQKLSTDAISRDWASSLATSKLQAEAGGQRIIKLRNEQNTDLQSMLSAQAGFTDLLTSLKMDYSHDSQLQVNLDGMHEASRALLTAVTAYLASPDDVKRVHFTDSAVRLRQGASQLESMNNSVEGRKQFERITSGSNDLQSLGSQLIGERDLQQSLFANFIATMFTAGQQTIVKKIQPHETEQLSLAQKLLQQAVTSATLVSVLLPIAISLLAGWMVYRLARQMTDNVRALLDGADRVTGGNLVQPVPLDKGGGNELDRLAEAFNNMMTGLASREERLRALISKLAQIQDEERRLIGLDLHDGLTQLIISANMHLNALSGLAGPKLDSQSNQELDLSRTMVKQAIEEARRVISEIRPTVLEDFGLVEGLRRYVIEISEAQRWQSEVLADIGSLQVPSPVDTAIFRIAQEALANARKHAQTEKVRVVFQLEGENLMLSVQDWGRGFDPDVFLDDMTHLGLVSMEERAQMLGGVCTIESVVGEGTTVKVVLPLSALANPQSAWLRSKSERDIR